MEIDIRAGREEAITSIRFFEAEVGGYSVAHVLERQELSSRVKIMDVGDFVAVTSVTHARNLIQALEEAIALGWLK